MGNSIEAKLPVVLLTAMIYSSFPQPRVTTRVAVFS